MPTWRRKRLARNRKKIAKDRLGLDIMIHCTMSYWQPWTDNFRAAVTDLKSGRTFEAVAYMGNFAQNKEARNSAISAAVAKANEWRQFCKRHDAMMQERYGCDDCGIFRPDGTCACYE